MTTDADRRAALAAAKLGALARARFGDVGPEARAGSFPDGASLVEPAGGRAWILLGADAPHRLGAALALADRAGVGALHLLVEGADAAADAAVLARRAQLFAAPPAVWLVVGTELEAVAPAPPGSDPAPPPEAELYRPVLDDAGLEVVVEGGHLIGELHGLEVARVVVDEGGSAHVEAGVGRFDREVGAMMFAELAETDALARAVEFVARHRRAGAPRHPLNQLVPDRWLRSVLVAEPARVGARELQPVGSAIARTSLRARGVATAVGTDLDGRPLVVTCSTGVDLELVPSAADDRLAHAPDARLVLAVPERDALPVTTELARHLRRPAEVVAVADDWAAAAEGLS
ncbi:MAG: hypothetical protein KDB04_05310 [Acidimicrobiales bacterium]|nr:hypothetical protein [Acidimicrobiales bacterium]HRW36638.1 hypothetical protein [Aquihabitans sp.]